ncbi:unnamed protein product, partial [Protopolystoma xenopodis]
RPPAKRRRLRVDSDDDDVPQEGNVSAADYVDPRDSENSPRRSRSKPLEFLDNADDTKAPLSRLGRANVDLEDDADEEGSGQAGPLSGSTDRHIRQKANRREVAIALMSASRFARKSSAPAGVSKQRVANQAKRDHVDVSDSGASSADEASEGDSGSSGSDNQDRVGREDGYASSIIATDNESEEDAAPRQSKKQRAMLEQLDQADDARGGSPPLYVSAFKA